MVIKSVNPATGRVLKVFDEMGHAEVDSALAQAQTAFQQW